MRWVMIQAERKCPRASLEEGNWLPKGWQVEPGMVALAFYPSTWEAEGRLRVQWHPGLHPEFKAHMD